MIKPRSILSKLHVCFVALDFFPVITEREKHYFVNAQEGSALAWMMK